MISVLDERHIARGYDPYNSADQPWALQLLNLKREVKRLTTPTPLEMLSVWRDHEIDEKIRRGLKYLERHPELVAEVFSTVQDIRSGIPPRRKFP